MNAIAKFLPVNTFVPFELSQEDMDWLNAWKSHTRYCYFFAVCTPDDRNYFGNWNAPFFSVDEANAFAKKIKEENPDIRLGLAQGNLTSEIITQDPENIFWEIWQNQHKERIAYLEQQTELKAQKQSERKEKLAKWLNAVKDEEHYCHYFCVFREGTEVYPFGLNQAPYYTFEEAEKVMRDYEFIQPQYNFYIGSGAIASDITFVDEYTNEAEKIWAEQHKVRLQSLSKESAA